MTRALLYARTSAAHLGKTADDLFFPELRRHAAAMEWEVVGEEHDSEPLPRGSRPGLQRLAARAAAGDVDVVLVQSLAQLFRDFRHLVQFGLALRRNGVALVAITEPLDTSRSDDSTRWGYVLELGRKFTHDLHSEAVIAGNVLAQREHTGRPRVVVNSLEVKTLWERGLSYDEMVNEHRKRGGTIGVGTLRRTVVALAEAGELDQARRQQAIERRGGLPVGGYKPKATSPEALERARAMVQKAVDDIAAGRRPKGAVGINRLAKLAGVGRGVVRKLAAELAAAPAGP